MKANAAQFVKNIKNEERKLSKSIERIFSHGKNSPNKQNLKETDLSEEEKCS